MLRFDPGDEVWSLVLPRSPTYLQSACHTVASTPSIPKGSALTLRALSKCGKESAAAGDSRVLLLRVRLLSAITV